MSASIKCPHKDFQFKVNVTILEDSNVRCIDLKITCNSCGTPMIFNGVPIGVSMAQPMASVGRDELRIPIVGNGETPDTTVSAVCRVHPE